MYPRYGTLAQIAQALSLHSGYMRLHSVYKYFECWNSVVGVGHNYFIYLETGKYFEYFKYLK